MYLEGQLERQKIMALYKIVISTLKCKKFLRHRYWFAYMSKIVLYQRWNNYVHFAIAMWFNRYI